MSEMKFTAIYEPAAEGGYVAYVAELPGANTQGETLAEARENLKDAVEMLLDCYRQDAESHVAGTPNATKEDLILQAA
jgi:predicted RNase H-like HicB family nuclease